VNYDRELETARDVALAAGKLQAEARAAMGAIEIKQDRSPVTEVDRQCEALIRDRLLKAFPQDGFLGEENGELPGTSGRTWIVDPIDGTRPYIRGIPTYSALVALEADGFPVVGVIHLEAMQETCWAAQGQGAFCNGRPVHVSDTPEPAQAMGSGFGHIQKDGTDQGRRLRTFMGCWDYAYGFMDAYSYACVACGRLDLCVNLLDKPWDSAAAACIITEAGGRFTDLDGVPSVHNGSSLFSNGRLHNAALQALQGEQ
jgi:histidinol phosphatase-like enzyme (inositol monophosphatase family)